MRDVKRPAQKGAPKLPPRRIRARPWEEQPEDHLQSILDRVAKAANEHTFCNLSPADCILLTGSINATVAALDSAECVVSQVAKDTFGKCMTVKEFADQSGYDS